MWESVASSIDTRAAIGAGVLNDFFIHEYDVTIIYTQSLLDFLRMRRKIGIPSLLFQL